MAHQSAALDAAFRAMADPTRRAVVSRLSGGPASVTELARPFAMALPSFMKHIRQLEASGWISTHKSGRVRTCAIDARSFDAVESWLAAQRRLWEAQTDRLAAFVETNVPEPPSSQHPTTDDKE